MEIIKNWNKNILNKDIEKFFEDYPVEKKTNKKIFKLIGFNIFYCQKLGKNSMKVFARMFGVKDENGNYYDCQRARFLIDSEELKREVFETFKDKTNISVKGRLSLNKKFIYIDEIENLNNTKEEFEDIYQEFYKLKKFNEKINDNDFGELKFSFDLNQYEAFYNGIKINFDFNFLEPELFSKILNKAKLKFDEFEKMIEISKNYILKELYSDIKNKLPKEKNLKKFVEEEFKKGFNPIHIIYFEDNIIIIFDNKDIIFRYVEVTLKYNFKKEEITLLEKKY